MTTKLGRPRWLSHALAAASLVSVTASAALVADAPLMTILDGEAILVDGAQRSQGVEGQALRDRTLIETGKGTRLLRIEWADGQTVDLGPDTRAMLAPPPLGGRGSKPRAVYVLQGWVKQSSPAASESKGLVSPDVDVQPFRGSVVGYVGTDEAWLFTESGSVSISERGKGKTASFDIPQSSAYTRIGDAQGAVTTNPPSQAMKRVPRAFRDPLPMRYEQLKGRETTGTTLPKPTYAELQPWLTAEPGVRVGFVPRFDELLRDRVFRRELAAHLRDHREWQPVLYPPPKQ